MLKQREKSRYLKLCFTLAVVDGRSRRSSIQKLAESVEISKQRPPKSLCVNLFGATGTQVFTDCELDKINNLAIILFGFALRD